MCAHKWWDKRNSVFICNIWTIILSILSAAKSIFIDGTFITVPRLFYQLFTILVNLEGHVFPATFVLMTRKTKVLYKAVFEYNKSLVPNFIQLMCASFCRLFVSFKLHAVSITRRFQFSCVTRRFLYTHFAPLSLLHAESVTHRFHYTRIQRFHLMISSSHSINSARWPKSVERRCGQTPAGDVPSQWGGEHRLSFHLGLGFWPQAVFDNTCFTSVGRKVSIKFAICL